ncbi:phosphopantetheine-binding protein [Streptomyces huiliensis]|uniref:phosphopantetheine-binding protein n=1 Tax=Streptomyces huiliensis TaxID=2876027 RepID=UPI0021E07C2D|nr:phosphopantetheine-binding protein [Streptomyces huiliensis]MBZ4323661.1 phosphopantetheine-binding protein [Streptomyces huiliensis]
MESTTPATGPLTGDDLRRILAETIGTTPDEIETDVNLIHQGLSSLQMMRLVTRWRREGLGVEFRDLAADPTVDAWERRFAEAWQARTADGTVQA